MNTQQVLLKALAANSVAVIGASDREGALGTPIWKSLSSAPYDGRIFPVNPKYRFLGERLCYASVKDIAGPIDLAVIALSYDKIESVLDDIAFKHIPWVILVDSNPNPDIRQLWQAHIVHEAKRLGIRIIGTDSLGLIRTDTGLNASYWQDMPAKGDIGFIAQSSDMAAAVLSYAKQHRLGFSSVINTGDEIDFGTSEMLDFLAQDPATKTIVVHVEGIRTPREFFSALKNAARIKPVLVIRGGGSNSSQALLTRRMGLPASDDDVFEAMIHRAGALRFHSLEELFAAMQAFATHRLPRAGRLGIICTGASFCILAADNAASFGVKLAETSSATIRNLSRASDVSLAENPVDVGIDAQARKIKLATDAFLKDENTDAVLVVIAAAKTDSVKHLCESLRYACEKSLKPVLTVWLSADDREAASVLLQEARIACMDGIQKAVGAFSCLARFASRADATQPPAHPLPRTFPVDLEAARAIVSQARETDCVVLNESETKRLLACIGLSTATGIIAHSANEAVDAAETLGYPVVLKAISKDITSKAEVGGIALNLKDAAAVHDAFVAVDSAVRRNAPFAQIEGFYVQRHIARVNARETKIAVRQDPAFGPYLEFGSGGRLHRLSPDKAVELIPLTQRAARDLIDRASIKPILEAFNNLPAVNFDELVKVMLRLSELATEVPAIKAVEIDPLLIDEGGCIVLNGSITLSQAPLERDSLSEYTMLAPAPSVTPERAMTREKGVLLRSICPEDFESLRAFIARLSPETTFARFRTQTNDLPAEKIAALVDIDYNREAAIVATDEELPEIIRGVARYTRINGSNVAEFGIVIEDSWQAKGLGTVLMNALTTLATRHGIRMIVGYVAVDNEAMCAFMRKAGFAKGSVSDSQFITFSKRL